MVIRSFAIVVFQLAAARRRLIQRLASLLLLACFNSQPPEGG